MTHLRIGHTRLTHDYLIKGTEEPKCEICQKKVTVKHFLVECPKYKVERINRQIPASLSKILDDGYEVKNLMLFLSDFNVISQIYPLLDRDLVDFTCTIPPEYKVKWKKNRYVFKQAMKGFLPDEIITKSKHGMGLPVTPWFKKDKQMNTLLHDIVFAGAPSLTHYVKPEFINKMKTAFVSDETTYYGDNLWVFLILEMWLRQKSDISSY